MTDSYGVNAAWLEVGLVDPASGSVDRPITAEEWRVPNAIELDRDRLVWTWDVSVSDEALRSTVRRPGNGMLDAFVRLADASGEQIRDYARRWGMLDICAHGLPRSHNPAVEPRQPNVGPGHPDFGCTHMRCDDEKYDDLWLWEPIAAWRWFAGSARAILNMIAAIQHGKAARPEDVQAAHKGFADQGWNPKTVEATKLVVGICVDEWLRLATVRPSLRLTGGASGTINIGGGGLFGALGVQLMFQAARTDGLAICSACGTAFVPLDANGRPRRPNPNRRRYCPNADCQRARSRDAARDYRSRKNLTTL